MVLALGDRYFCPAPLNGSVASFRGTHPRESVCIAAVYFGKLPEYFDLFLASCAANPSIDFLVFTDQPAPMLPQNVQFVRFSLESFASRAEEKLGLKVCLNRPYKLCDFKPVYGNILEDFFAGYDYWGHCDIDLIFGDLRACFDRYKLGIYDKFLPLGHLCLYRNAPEVLSRYSLPTVSPVSYKEAFCAAPSVAFDEVGGINAVYREYGFPAFNGRVFADISSIYRRFRLALDDVNYAHQAFCWQDGHVLRYYVGPNGRVSSDEFAYIHFKKRHFSAQQIHVSAGSPFFIGPDGFIELCGQVTVKEIDAANPYKGWLYEQCELISDKASMVRLALLRRVRGSA